MNVENVVKPPQKPTQRKDFRSLSMEHPCSARPYISPSMKHPSTLTMNVPSVKGISVWFCTKYETRYLNTPPAKLPMPMSNMVFIMMVKAAIQAFNACIRYFIFYFSFAIYYLVSTIGVYLFCKGTVFCVFLPSAECRLLQKRKASAARCCNGSLSLRLFCRSQRTDDSICGTWRSGVMPFRDRALLSVESFAAVSTIGTQRRGSSNVSTSSTIGVRLPCSASPL